MSDPVPSAYGSLLYDDYADCLVLNNSAVLSRSWGGLVSGTGASFGGPIAPGASNRWGLTSFMTGTTSGGWARIATGGAACLAVASAAWFYAQAVLGVPVLSTVGDSYTVYAGLGDVANSPNQSQIQAGFLYDAQGVAAGGVASPYWQAWVRDGASVTVIPLDGAVHSGIATQAALVGVVDWPTSANVYNLEVACVPGAFVTFKVNGVVVAVLPAMSAANTNAMGQIVAIVKAAGTTVTALHLDYVRIAMQRVGLPSP